MSMANLLNLSISIAVSDPWEFGTECGTGPFVGTIIDATAEKLLVRLLKPISYQGKTLHVAVAQCRHVGETLENISQKSIPSNLLLLPNEVKALVQLSPASTREGVAAIGTVERKS